MVITVIYKRAYLIGSGSRFSRNGLNRSNVPSFPCSSFFSSSPFFFLSFYYESDRKEEEEEEDRKSFLNWSARIKPEVLCNLERIVGSCLGERISFERSTLKDEKEVAQKDFNTSFSSFFLLFRSHERIDPTSGFQHLFLRDDR